MPRRKPIPHETAESFAKKINGILDAIDELDILTFRDKCTRAWAWVQLQNLKEDLIKQTYAASN